jgi:arylsulfatase A-like enzyme
MRTHHAATLHALVAALVLSLSGLVVLHTGAAVNATPVATPGGGAPAAARTSADGRPNILVMMADDMRHDDLAFMPRLRRLVARSGTEMANAFSPYPLCCPARASFLTGRAAHNHRVYWHDRPYGFGAFDDRFTIGTALERAGYRTGFLGKYLNGYGRQRSKVTGRPSYRYVPRGWTEWYGAIDRPRGASWSGGPYSFFNTVYNDDGQVDTRHKGEYQTNTLGRATRRMVSRLHQGGRPFFVFSSFVAPHQAGPHEKDDPPRYLRRRDGEREKFPTTARPRWVRGKFDARIRRAAGVPRGGGPTEVDVTDKPRGQFRAPEMTRRERRALREVTRQRAEALYVLDQEVGRTVRHLKRKGLWSRTVLVFTSDNGFYLGEHRKRTGKVSAHEPSLRVPLLVTGPGVPHGATRFDPVTTMDLTATLADLGGAADEFPYALDGTSVLPSLRDGDQGWTRPVLTESLYGVVDGSPRTWRVKGYPQFRDARGSMGVRLSRYKVIVYASGFVELYDLARDPHELDGVQGDPAYAEVRAAMLDLWWSLKDCRATACAPTLPDALASGPGDNADLTLGMTRARVARYGR